MRGKVIALSPAEAWSQAWEIVSKLDPEVPGRFERVTKDANPLVIESIRAMGIQALCYGKEPVAVVRSQFIAIYEQLMKRDERLALLPAKLKAEIEAGPSRALPAKVVKAIEGIGRGSGS